ncbi:MAG: hypothetical protein DRJ40_00095 [Thermoprotei archaeon]|nr:MAG: hypothetical protein DRJ40_00095 [Thermoprotei archaeon]
MRVIAVPIASRKHDPSTYLKLLHLFKSRLRELGIEFHQLVLDEKDINLEKVRGYDLILLLLLTGGTARLAQNLAEKTRRKVVAVAHYGLNSLPSALTLKSRLRNMCLLLHSNSVDDVAKSLVRICRGLQGLLPCYHDRVLYIGDSVPRKPPLLERLGIEVVKVKLNEYLDFAREVRSNVDEESTRVFSTRLATFVKLQGISGDIVRELYLHYRAITKLLKERRCGAVTIDCFNFIDEFGVTPCVVIALLLAEGCTALCEGDLTTYIPVKVATELTGRPGWVCNVCGIRGGLLALAHCTIALNLCEDAVLLPHFETGKPISVGGRLGLGTYTLVRVDEDSSDVYVMKVRGVASGVMFSDICRTQLLCEVPGHDARTVIDELSGNHHVVVCGDVVEYLKYITWFLDARLVEYVE